MSKLRLLIKGFLTHNSKGNIVIPVLFAVTALSIFLVSGDLINISFVDKSIKYGEPKTEETDPSQNLQLKKLSFQARPTPVGDSCNHDMSKKADPDKCSCTAWLVKCEGGKCVDVDVAKSGIPGTKEEVCKTFDDNNWCQIFSKEGDGWYCIGKPVIYLYPEYPMLVDVAVRTAGRVVVSDPQIEEYETSPYIGRWKDVMAHPNGILFYKDHPYRELFYETETQVVKEPEKGILIEKGELEPKLLEFIARLGLTKKDEQREFMDWWLPRLEEHDSPYWFVSILENEEKQRLDKVEIEPQPDTFIEFIVYFKPLEKYEAVNLLQLPPTPERIGFTAVEWGGVIAK